MKKTLLIIVCIGALALAGCVDLTDDPGDEINGADATAESPPASDDTEEDDTAAGDDSSDDDTNGLDPPENDEEEIDESDGDEEERAPDDGILEIHAINVGQADATLLIAPSGDTMLIDTGDWTDDGEIVLDYLETQDIERIDHLVSTHAHADHIGGHAAVIERYETEKEGIGAVWDSGVTHTTQTYERYLDAIEDHDVTLYGTYEGDEIPIDGVEATVLNPAEDPVHSDDLHHNSVTVLVEHGEVAFLATGDAEEAAEQRLVEDYGSDLEAEIYHAGHHGSSTSSTKGFLAAVDPDISIISAAYDSQFGHPHTEVIDRFASHDIAAVWTATHGSTVFSSDGDSYEVHAQADATVNPRHLRAEPEIVADPASVPDIPIEIPEEISDDEGEDEDGTDDYDSDPGDETNLHIAPASSGTSAEHIWTYDDIDFSGSVDEIRVEYPDGTIFDGLTQDNVTVTMERQLADGADTAEISVNQDSYAGTSATFDLSGAFNTELAGFLEVQIDGVENPDVGDHTATITVIGDEDQQSRTEEFSIG